MPTLQTSTLVGAIIAVASLVVLVDGAAAGSLNRPEIQKPTNSAESPKRILERTDGAPAADVLAAPATLARWIDAHRGRQVTISIDVAR